MIPLHDMPQKFSCRQFWQIANPHLRQRQANGNVSRQQWQSNGGFLFVLRRAPPLFKLFFIPEY
jgi:hypothetical protein